MIVMEHGLPTFITLLMSKIDVPLFSKGHLLRLIWGWAVLFDGIVTLLTLGLYTPMTNITVLEWEIYEKFAAHRRTHKSGKCTDGGCCE